MSNDDTSRANSRHFVVRPAQRLSASGNVVSDTNDDVNPILMEAKLLEMISSLRQLIQSNQQLDEALIEECDNGGDITNCDQELLQALTENESVILRKHNDAIVLAAKLSKHGGNISLADKIPQYSGSIVLKKTKEKEEEKNKQSGGLYL